MTKQLPLFLPVLLVLAACGGEAAAPSAPVSASPKPASSSASAQASAKPSTAASSTTAKPSAVQPSAAGSSNLVSLNAAFVAITTHTLPTWVADAKGIFRQQGLNVHVSYVQGSTTAVPALASGDLSIIQATPGASVQAQLKGQDTVALATHIPYADERLMAMGDVKTMNDLKGKTVAVTKAGTVTDVVIRAILQKNNLVPDKDVKITYLDTQPGQLAAIQKGLVQAVLIDPPFDLALEKAGAHLLLDSFALKYPYPVDGVVSTRKFVREHPDVVVKYLKAFVQAIRFMRANPAESKQVLSQQTKETDADVLDAAYKAVMEVIPDNPVPATDGIQTVLPLFGGEGKNPADFVDPAPLAQAMKELGQ